MLFKYRNGLLDQIGALEAEDSPYRDKADEIKKNLKLIMGFIDRQIYERQVLREKNRELKKEASERLINPMAAAMRQERKQFRLLTSMGGRLNEMNRMLAAAKSSDNDTIKYDMMRRALEISVELNHRISYI